MAFIEKQLGSNPKYSTSDLKQKAIAEKITINIRNKIVTVDFVIETETPNGLVVQSVSKAYDRYNREDIYYEAGEVITPAVYSVPNGIELPTLITPAVIAKGDKSAQELKLAGNMKWDALQNSPVGQMLKGMIQLDLDTIQSEETADDDLKQN